MTWPSPPYLPVVTWQVVHAALPPRLRALRSLTHILPVQTWLLPALVLVYATPTAAIALSLWTHLWRLAIRLAPPEEEAAADGDAHGKGHAPAAAASEPRPPRTAAPRSEPAMRASPTAPGSAPAEVRHTESRLQRGRLMSTVI